MEKPIRLFFGGAVMVIPILILVDYTSINELVLLILGIFSSVISFIGLYFHLISEVKDEYVKSENT